MSLGLPQIGCKVKFKTEFALECSEIHYLCHLGRSKGPWKVCLQIRGRTRSFPRRSVQLVVVGHFRGCRTPMAPTPSSLLPSLRFSSAELEVKLNFSRLLAARLAKRSGVLSQSVTFQVNFCPENYKLLLLTIRFLTQMMIPCKMSPQILIVCVESLQTVSIAEVTEVVVFPQVLVQLFIVKISIVTVLAVGVTLHT